MYDYSDKKTKRPASGASTLSPLSSSPTTSSSVGAAKSQIKTQKAFNPLQAGRASFPAGASQTRERYKFSNGNSLPVSDPVTKNPFGSSRPSDSTARYEINQNNRPMDTITRSDGSVTAMSDVLAERRARSAAIGNTSGQDPLSTTAGGPRSSQYGQEAQNIASRLTRPTTGVQQTQPARGGFVDPATADTVGYRADTAGNRITNGRRYSEGYGAADSQIDALKSNAAATDAFYRNQAPSPYDPVAQQTAQEDSAFAYTQTSPETLAARSNVQAYENPLGSQQANEVTPVSSSAFSAPFGSSAAQDDNPYSVMNQVSRLDAAKAEKEKAKQRETFLQLAAERNKKMGGLLQAQTDAYSAAAKGPATLEPEQDEDDYSPYGDERNPGGISRYNTRWRTGF